MCWTSGSGWIVHSLSGRNTRPRSARARQLSEVLSISAVTIFKLAERGTLTFFRVGSARDSVRAQLLIGCGRVAARCPCHGM
jgi:hypothetical protein